MGTGLPYYRCHTIILSFHLFNLANHTSIAVSFYDGNAFFLEYNVLCGKVSTMNATLPFLGYGSEGISNIAKTLHRIRGDSHFVNIGKVRTK
jgi:hypothetical protein